MSGIVFIACRNIAFDWWPTAIYQISCNSSSEGGRNSIFILPTAASLYCSQESSVRRDIYMDIYKTDCIVISSWHNLHISLIINCRDWKLLFNNDLVYLNSCPNLNSISSHVIVLHEICMHCVFSADQKKSPTCKLMQPSVIQKSFLDCPLDSLPYWNLWKKYFPWSFSGNIQQQGFHCHQK